jgi:hypothetical protein
MAYTKHTASLQFQLKDDAYPRFSPRLSEVILKRPGSVELSILTPGLITSTVRGLVPHLARDNMRATNAIRWVNVPFETL